MVDEDSAGRRQGIGGRKRMFFAGPKTRSYRNNGDRFSPSVFTLSRPEKLGRFKELNRPTSSSSFPQSADPSQPLIMTTVSLLNANPLLPSTSLSVATACGARRRPAGSAKPGVAPPIAYFKATAISSVMALAQ